MFDSLFNNIENTFLAFIIILLVALVLGTLNTFILSFGLNSSKKFFVTNSIMTAVIAVALALVSGSTGIAIGIAAVGIGLLRFRSVQATSSEIAALFINIIAGVILGAGYIFFSVVFSLLLTFTFLLLSKLNIFIHKNSNKELIVKVTIPEDLNYVDEFKETFEHYTKEYEYIKVKTSDMGSLYKLSVRVLLKDPNESKALLDEIRQKNGNMEVAIMPYSETQQTL